MERTASTGSNAPRLARAQAQGLSLNQLTLAELQSEIQRRIEKLQEERQTILQRLEAIDAQLAQVEMQQSGADADPKLAGKRSATTRRANSKPLRAVLVDVFTEAGRALTTREAADAALETGYTSTSRNFTNTVYVTLHKEAQFVRSDEGTWSLAPAD